MKHRSIRAVLRSGRTYPVRHVYVAVGHDVEVSFAAEFGYEGATGHTDTFAGRIEAASTRLQRPPEHYIQPEEEVKITVEG